LNGTSYKKRLLLARITWGERLKWKKETEARMGRDFVTYCHEVLILKNKLKTEEIGSNKELSGNLLANRLLLTSTGGPQHSTSRKIKGVDLYTLITDRR